MDPILIPVGLKLHPHQFRQCDHPQPGSKQFPLVNRRGHRSRIRANFLAGPTADEPHVADWVVVFEEHPHAHDFEIVHPQRQSDCPVRGRSFRSKRMSTSFVTRTASGSLVATQAATACPPTMACGTPASPRRGGNSLETLLYVIDGHAMKLPGIQDWTKGQDRTWDLRVRLLSRRNMQLTRTIHSNMPAGSG